MEEETKISPEASYGTMDSLRRIFRRKTDLEEYEPLADEATALEGSALLDGQDEVPYSRVVYAIFCLLGMAMLWAW
jgi:solute carrier family 29 (equilibrative nucleoside transporter), member 1/2/3